MLNTFKKKHNLEQRKNESSKIIQKYEDRIPIIVTKDPKCKSLEDINKNKFLAPIDLTLGQFLIVIRKRINLADSEALFVFVDESVLATTSQTIGTLYNSHKDEDGFLYMMYCSENVFG
jgi:GABA(A) receptor-associated protein